MKCITTDPPFHVVSWPYKYGGYKISIRYPTGQKAPTLEWYVFEWLMTGHDELLIAWFKHFKGRQC